MSLVADGTLVPALRGGVHPHDYIFPRVEFFLDRLGPQRELAKSVNRDPSYSRVDAAQPSSAGLRLEVLRTEFRFKPA